MIPAFLITRTTGLKNATVAAASPETIPVYHLVDMIEYIKIYKLSSIVSKAKSNDSPGATMRSTTIF